MKIHKPTRRKIHAGGKKKGKTAKERLGNMRGHICFEEGHSFEDMSEESAQAILNVIDKTVAEDKAKKGGTPPK
ncbi:hypothetical protein HY625_00040 [Candidatus Uhrbacteria bacterium]|nr:hypothetical protein [Candidatus Uhrbacteria bacterium]